MATTTKKKIPSIVTGNLVTKFSNLNKVDDFKRSRTHNITVEYTKELAQLLDEAAADIGATKINGLNTTKDGVAIIKFKNKKSPEAGESFPCVDSKGQPTKVFPFGGDVVRLRLWPMPVTDDDGKKTVSFLLFGCQIITKQPFTKREDFDEVEGGYVEGAPTKAPAESDDPEIPF